MSSSFSNMLSNSVQYRTPQKQGACVIEIDGTETFHERCQCANTEVNRCKEYCDTDQNCRGYVMKRKKYYCQVATTSDCPSGCSKYNDGSIGTLVIDSQYVSQYYQGCFIKRPGNL